MTRDTLRRAVLPAAVFAACAFLLMPQALLGQRTYAAVDIMEPEAPYRDALGRPPHVESLVQTDQAESIAARVAFFRALRGGTFQRWDPEPAAGQPIGTLPLGALMSPFSAGFLFLPGWYAIGFRIFLALVFSQTFTYLLLRRLGAAAGPAVLAGVAYAFSGTSLVFIHRVDVVFLVPALFWAAHRLHAEPGARAAVGAGWRARAALGAGWRARAALGAGWPVKRMAVLAGLVAWGWFEGFPSGWIYAVYATGAWAAWLALRGAGPSLAAAVRRAVPAGLAMVWGVALAAVTLVPFVFEVVDRGTLDVRAGASSSHIPPIQLFGLFDLSAIGPPLKGPWWSGLTPVESVSHAGMIAAVALAAALVLGTLGRIRLGPEGAVAWPFFCGMAAVAFVVCFLGTPLSSVLERLPGVARNPIGRSRFLLNLAVVVLGALALDAWWSGSAGNRVRASRAAAAGLLAVLVAAVAWYAPDFARVASANNRLRDVAIGFGSALLVAALAATVAWLAVLRPSARRTVGATVAIAGLLFFELGWPLRHFTPEAPVADFYGEVAGHRALRDLLDGRYRFAATEYSFYPNSGQALDLPDLRGLALRSEELRAVVEAASPQAFARDPLKINLKREEWNLASPLLDHLAVGYFAEGTGELPYGRVADAPDLTWDRWAAAGELAEEATSGVAPGPLNGVYLPLRAGGRCRGAAVRLSLLSGGRTLATSSRAAFDVGGGWTGFAILGRELAAGDRYQLRVASTEPGCRVDIGMAGPRVARQLLVEDPGQAIRLASTEQAWIYERPSAWELVSAHRRWRAFPDQAGLLAWAVDRPPEDADVAAYVGPDRPGSGAAVRDPVVLSSEVVDNSARAVVQGDAESLLVVSQDLAEGWTARIDGEPADLVAVDGALQGVFVPAGRHTVVLSYMPRTFVLGLAVTAPAAAALVLAWLLPWRRRRRPVSPGLS